MRTLKVLSYNMHKAVSPLGTRSTLERMRDELRFLDPDLIFLQEVVGHELEPSQFEFLAEDRWPYFRYGKNAIYDPDHHGNAILSRHPIVASSHIDLSTNRFERRGLLQAVIESPSGCKELHAFSTHLNLLEGARERQLKKIILHIRKCAPAGAPIILAGDFNDWREKAHQILLKSLDLNEAFLSLDRACAQTFPSAFPLLCLDRIYFRGLDIIRAQKISHRPWPSLSDHLPIAAEFSFC